MLFSNKKDFEIIGFSLNCLKWFLYYNKTTILFVQIA